MMQQHAKKGHKKDDNTGNESLIKLIKSKKLSR